MLSPMLSRSMLIIGTSSLTCGWHVDDMQLLPGVLLFKIRELKQVKSQRNQTNHWRSQINQANFLDDLLVASYTSKRWDMLFWQKTFQMTYHSQDVIPTPSNDRVYIEWIFVLEKDSMYLVLKTTQNDENVHNDFWFLILIFVKICADKMTEFIQNDFCNWIASSKIQCT